jgi:sarcosine oxidase
VSVERTEFVVVGGGLLGLATAYALQLRGREVVVLEQHTVGHERAGSKGASRIFRLGYPDPLYVQMAVHALRLWRTLEARAAAPLLLKTGQVSFGPHLDTLLEALHSADAPAERVSLADVHALFPELGAPGDAIYEPESAVIDAIGTLAALSASLDIREDTTVTAFADDGRRVRVESPTEAFEARVAVMCVGHNANTLLPLPTYATLEHIAYFRGGSPAAIPIFISWDRDPALYGLPTPALNAYKLAFHHAGERVTPHASLEPDPEQVDALRQAAHQWIPNFDAEPVRVETCFYDNTASEDFVLTRRGNVVIGCGTSGHGFKFGPLLGEILADLATGTPPAIDLARFGVPEH